MRVSQSRRIWALQYGVAAVAVAVGLGVRLVLHRYLGAVAPYITFFPAVMFAGWFGGVGPGILAATLSLLAADYLVIPPLYSLRMNHSSDTIAAIAFLLDATFITVLNEALRRAGARSEERSQQLASETERRTKAEGFLAREVAERTAQLRIANRELENFAYVASHDLKAPLRVIENAAKWLEEDLAQHLDADTRENMNLIRGRIKRMEKLLDDLLAYARIGGGPGESHSEIVAGDALMSNILGLLSTGGFTVKVSSGFAGIEVPQMPLQQILLNLIGNAIKHHDKKEGCIEVSVEDSGAEYAFAVKDDGPGIAPCYHQRVFEMFQTLRSRDQVEGSGMGLAMVRKNVEISGGTIQLESEEGKGSTFRFTFPKRPHRKGMAA